MCILSSLEIGTPKISAMYGTLSLFSPSAYSVSYHSTSFTCSSLGAMRTMGPARGLSGQKKTSHHHQPKTDRIADEYGRSRTCIVPLGRREDRNIPRTTDSPRPALDLEIWKEDGSRHCIRGEPHTRQGSNREQAPQQLISRKRKIYQLYQAWSGKLISKS